jgi:hypothetical protein
VCLLTEKNINLVGSHTFMVIVASRSGSQILYDGIKHQQE